MLMAITIIGFLTLIFWTYFIADARIKPIALTDYVALMIVALPIIVLELLGCIYICMYCC